MFVDSENKQISAKKSTSFEHFRQEFHRGVKDLYRADAQIDAHSIELKKFWRKKWSVSNNRFKKTNDFSDKIMEHQKIALSHQERIPAQESLVGLPLRVSGDRIFSSGIPLSVLLHVFHRQFEALSADQSRIHEFLCAILSSFLCTDRWVVIESDFSRPTPLAAKYLIRPLLPRGVRKISQSPKSRLFLRQEGGRLVPNADVGTAANLSVLFGNPGLNRNYDFIENVIGARGDSLAYLRFLKGKYCCLYIFPCAAAEFEAYKDKMNDLFQLCCGQIAFVSEQKLDRNLHRSQLRHTLGVQITRLSTSMTKIDENRKTLLGNFSKKRRTRMNQIFSSMSESIEFLAIDAAEKFSDEFDYFGNRVRIGATAEPLDKKTVDEIRAALIETIAHVSGVELHFRLDSVSGTSSFPLPWVSFMNFAREAIENASKYAVGSKIVDVVFRSCDDEFEIEFGNVAQQLDNDELNRIPTFGMRSLSAISSTKPGTGKGLASAEQALRRSGGDLAISQSGVPPFALDRVPKEMAIASLGYFVVKLIFCLP